MYLIIYISVAYSTIRWHAKERVAIQWITCVFVISLAVDEARQVCVIIPSLLLYDCYRHKVHVFVLETLDSYELWYVLQFCPIVLVQYNLLYVIEID